MVVASILVARRTGRYEASAAPAIASSAAPTSVGGSSASISKSSARTIRVAPAAPARPISAPSAGEPDRLAQHKATHTSRGRAERDANRNLPIALADVRRHHGVEPDRREQQRRKSKDAQQEGIEPWTGEGNVEHPCKRRNAHDAYVPIHGAQPLASKRRHHLERSAASQHQHLSRDEKLRGRQIERRPRLCQVAVPGRRRDADDGAPWIARARSAGLQTLADGTLAGPGTIGDVCADDRHFERPLPIGISECTATHHDNLERREIVGIYRLEIQRWIRGGALRALPLGGELRHIPAAIAGERPRVDGRCGGDRRQSLDSVTAPSRNCP